MVGSTDENASRAGLQVLQQGGNAVDAAVAVGFALAVTHPAAGNLGGGGFMVIRMADGRETSVDYREKAPARAHRDMFLDEAGQLIPNLSIVGPLAAGVPGSVAGMAFAQRTYGRLPLADVVAPAIALARDGFEVSWALADSLKSAQALLAKFPSSARAFRRPDGTMPGPGDRLVQPELAKTLTLIAEQGPDAFYTGPIAELIAAEMSRSGGFITKADLAAYTPRERPPIVGSYRGHRVVSMAPPSSGGIGLVQLLNILEAFPLADYGHNSSRSIHLVAEAARRVYADRSEWLGDPAFFDVPVVGLLSRRYADQLRSGISETRATSSRDVKPGQPRNFEHSQTTHYSVVDADGNAVATTTTLNGSYGNGQMVTGAGFLLNNEMDDFSAKPGAPNMFGLIGGEANAVGPGKRMLSSMTPAIVAKNGKLVLVTGSPGGRTIINTVLHVVLGVTAWNLTGREAVDAPRWDHEWMPDRVTFEGEALSPAAVEKLKAMGYDIVLRGEQGSAQTIWMHPQTGTAFGIADLRSPDAKAVKGGS